jgi:diguanylate cyclase (GGDEF)-like protein
VLRLDSARPGVYTQDDLRLLDILLDLITTAVTNGRLFAQTQRLAVTDSLTGLSLRRPFVEQLTRELTRAGRSREPVSLLMVDVDHFKHYNDAFGHTTGDLVLKGVAEVLRTAAPPGAVVARYGGEEFAVLLPQLGREPAASVAEKIRHAVEQRLRPLGQGMERPVTASIGLAAFPEDGQSELELVRRADQRLYAAKRAGKNRVCAT